MSQVVEFRPRPRLRLFKPSETGAVILQFPYKVMRRRLDQLLRQHLSNITRARRQRDYRFLGGDWPGGTQT